ncbi:AtpZ/AtpI family protein [Knoellia sinensis]|uniref:AtpZ/AtpI family protein n=1 Tax=Knoellia sinensis TaxID=136100 RepID=UPI00068DBFC9|nr:AtpZ/AtpI family protein [Knoellia sinensis]
MSDDERKIPKGVEGHEPFAKWHDDPELPSSTARADALGATVIAYLITGPAVFGAIGFGLDKLLGTGFIVVLGILAGMGLSLYTIWLRYGTS